MIASGRWWSYERLLAVVSALRHYTKIQSGALLYLSDPDGRLLAYRYSLDRCHLHPELA